VAHPPAPLDSPPSLLLFPPPPSDDPGNPCKTVEDLCGSSTCALDIKTAKFKGATGKAATCCLAGSVPIRERRRGARRVRGPGGRTPTKCFGTEVRRDLRFCGAGPPLKRAPCNPLPPSGCDDGTGAPDVGYSCQACPAGFHTDTGAGPPLPKCVNPAACSPPCANGGKCVGVNTCDCAGTGFEGATCTTAGEKWRGWGLALWEGPGIVERAPGGAPSGR
jgi:hypothetical protein